MLRTLRLVFTNVVRGAALSAEQLAELRKTPPPVVDLEDPARVGKITNLLQSGYRLVGVSTTSNTEVSVADAQREFDAVQAAIRADGNPTFVIGTVMKDERVNPQTGVKFWAYRSRPHASLAGVGAALAGN